MNWSLLRLPVFRALWTGRILSWLGSGLGPLALVFAAVDLGADPEGVGVVIACRSVPNIALVLVGGVVADRLSKRTVAIGSSIVSAVGLAAAAVTLATGAASLPLLCGAAAVSGVGAALFVPATSALVREIVGDRLLRDATVLNRLGANGGLALGTAIGGGLVGALSPEIALAAGSLLFTFAVAAFAGLPRLSRGAVRGTSILSDLAGGLGFVVRTPWLAACLGLVLVAQLAFAGGVQVIGPFAADDSFGRTLWGFAGAVQTLGLAFGSVVAGRLRGRLRLGRAVFAMAGIALPLVVLALDLAVAPGVIDPLHWLFWLCVALFAAGIGLELFAVPLDVAIQLQVPRPYLARVYAALTLATLAGMPVGDIVVGPITRALGAPVALAALASLVVVAVAAVALTPRVRRVDRVSAS
jgi:hypothetical protein